MPAPDPNTPILGGGDVAAGGSGTQNLGTACGNVYVRNAGPDTLYVTNGGTPPTASRGNGRFGLLSGEGLRLIGTGITSFSFATAGGETASYDFSAVPGGG